MLLLASWLRSWQVGSKARHRRRARRWSRRAHHPRLRPWIEGLEERLLPASVFTWTLAAGGNWDTPGAWLENNLPSVNVPGPNDTAVVLAGLPALTISVTNADQVNSFDFTADPAVSLKVSGATGSLTVTGPNPSKLGSDLTVSQGGTFTATDSLTIGGSVLVQDGGSKLKLQVGATLTTGSLTVQGGGVIEDIGATSITGADLAVATLTVNGSTQAVSGGLSLGTPGVGGTQGSLTIEGGGRLTITGNLTVNQAGPALVQGANSALQMNGNILTAGSLTVQGGGVAEDNANTGSIRGSHLVLTTLTVDGSTQTLGNDLSLGTAGAGGTQGTLTVKGGGTLIATGNVTVNQAGPVQVQDANSTFQLRAGGQAKILTAGSLTVQGGGVIEDIGATSITGADLAVATLTVNGSTQAVSGGLSLGTPGVGGTQGSLTIEGGGRLTIGGNLTVNQAGPALVQGANSALQMNGNTLTAGSLTVQGGGVAEDNANTSSIRGSHLVLTTLTVDGSTQTLGNDLSLGTAGQGGTQGSLTVKGGGTLIATGNVTVNQSGPVQVQGANSTFQLRAGNQAKILTAGSLTVQGGGVIEDIGATSITGADLAIASFTVNGTTSEVVSGDLGLGTGGQGGTKGALTIEGGGSLTANGNVTVNQAGAALVQDANSTLQLQAGNSLTAGSLTVQGGGVVEDAGATSITGGDLAVATLIVNGSNQAVSGDLALGSGGTKGALTVEGAGTLTATGNVTVNQAGAVIVQAANSTFQLKAGKALTAGSLTVQGGGVVEDIGATSITGADLAIPTLTVDGSSQAVSGDLALGSGGTKGALTVKGGGTLTANGNVTVNLAGAVQVQAANSKLQLQIGKTLTAGSLTVQGGGVVEDIGATSITAADLAIPTLTVDGSSQAVSGDLTLGAGGTKGTLTVEGAGTLTANGSVTINQAGAVIVQAANSTFQLQAGKTLTAGSLTVQNGGVIEDIGATSVTGGDLAVGSFTVDATTTQAVSGNLAVGTGSVTVKNGGTLTVFAISGAGSVTVQDPNSSLQVQLGGSLAVGSLTLQGGGAVQDVGGPARTIAGAKLAVGTLDVNNSTQTVTGTFTIQTGAETATVEAGGALTVDTFHVGTSGTSGTLTIQSGGTLTITANGNVTVNDSTNPQPAVPGAVVVQDAGSTLEMQAGATLNAGSLTVANGAVHARGNITIAQSTQIGGPGNVGGVVQLEESAPGPPPVFFPGVFTSDKLTVTLPGLLIWPSNEVVVGNVTINGGTQQLFGTMKSLTLLNGAVADVTTGVTVTGTVTVLGNSTIESTSSPAGTLIAGHLDVAPGASNSVTLTATTNIVVTTVGTTGDGATVIYTHGTLLFNTTTASLHTKELTLEGGRFSDATATVNLVDDQLTATADTSGSTNPSTTGTLAGVVQPVSVSVQGVTLDVSAGTLSGTPPPVTLQGGGTLKLEGATTVGAVIGDTGTNSVTGAALNATKVTVQNGGTLNVQNTLTPSSVEIDGPNSTLQVNGTLAGTPAVTLKSGGTLGVANATLVGALVGDTGTNSLTGAALNATKVTVQNGGTLSVQDNLTTSSIEIDGLNGIGGPNSTLQADGSNLLGAPAVALNGGGTLSDTSNNPNQFVLGAVTANAGTNAISGAAAGAASVTVQSGSLTAGRLNVQGNALLDPNTTLAVDVLTVQGGAILNAAALNFGTSVAVSGAFNVQGATDTIQFTGAGTGSLTQSGPTVPNGTVLQVVGRFNADSVNLQGGTLDTGPTGTSSQVTVTNLGLSGATNLIQGQSRLTVANDLVIAGASLQVQAPLTAQGALSVQNGGALNAGSVITVNGNSGTTFSDTATFQNGGGLVTRNLTVNGGDTTFRAGSTLTATSNLTLTPFAQLEIGTTNATVTNQFLWSGGTLNRPVGTAILPRLTVQGGVQIPAPAANTGPWLLQGLRLENDGTATIQGGVIVQQGAQWLNSGATNAVTTLTGSGGFSSTSPQDFVFLNQPGAQVVMNGSGTAKLGWTDNEGTIAVNSGTLVVGQGGGTEAGAFQAASGTLRLLGTGPAPATLTGKVSGAGQVVFDFGNQASQFNVLGSYDLTGTTTVQGGAGPQSLLSFGKAFNGSLYIQSGIVTLSQPYALPSGKTLTFDFNGTQLGQSFGVLQTPQISGPSAFETANVIVNVNVAVAVPSTFPLIQVIPAGGAVDLNPTVNNNNPGATVPALKANAGGTEVDLAFVLPGSSQPGGPIVFGLPFVGSSQTFLLPGNISQSIASIATSTAVSSGASQGGPGTSGAAEGITGAGLEPLGDLAERPLFDLTSFDRDTSASATDLLTALTRSLLTGARSTADVMRQKGSSLAPVGALVSTEVEEEELRRLDEEGDDAQTPGNYLIDPGPRRSAGWSGGRASQASAAAAPPAPTRERGPAANAVSPAGSLASPARPVQPQRAKQPARPDSAVQSQSPATRLDKYAAAVSAVVLGALLQSERRPFLRLGCRVGYGLRSGSRRGRELRS